MTATVFAFEALQALFLLLLHQLALVLLDLFGDRLINCRRARTATQHFSAGNAAAFHRLS